MDAALALVARYETIESDARNQMLSGHFKEIHAELAKSIDEAKDGRLAMLGEVGYVWNELLKAVKAPEG